MGLSYRRRVRIGKNSWLNTSTRSTSVSRRFGPVTVNSKGRTTVRLGKGLSYRGKGCLMMLILPIGITAALATTLAVALRTR